MKACLPVVVIVGRPNVGKSTLFNRVVGRRVAVVEDSPGITRDRLYAEAQWGGKHFVVVDTGGILFSEDDPLTEQIRVQAEVALAEADVVVFMADLTAGVTPDDWDLAEHLRRVKKPILVVVNKTDNPQREQLMGEFFALGLGDVFPISSLHGRGVAEVLDAVAERVPKVDPEAAEEDIRVAIVGRPNVGKSSMVNAFTGEQRTIVSDIPGTTRDAIDTELQYKGKRFRLVDTAGLRRRGKIQGSVEYYMAHRSAQALERADCALVVVDGSEGLTDGDKRTAKLAHDAGKALVIAVNKWDVKEPPDGLPRQKSLLKKDFTKIIRNQAPEFSYARICFTSALESAGLEPVLDTVMEAMESYTFRVPTGRLNRLIQNAAFERPYSSKGKSLKIYYATQATTKPPTFILFVNDPDLLHFSYLRYLENRLRAEFPMEGTPIRMVVRERKREER